MRALSTITVILIALAISFVQLRSCVVAPWQPPDRPTFYAIHGVDERQFQVVLLPDHRAVVLYTDPAEDVAEGVSSIWRGTDSDYYFAGLWRTDGPGGIMGWSRFPSGLRPYSMEIEIREKFQLGTGQSSLPDKGERTRGVVAFGPGQLFIRDMLLSESELDRELLDDLADAFEDPEMKKALRTAIDD